MFPMKFWVEEKRCKQPMKKSYLNPEVRFEWSSAVDKQRPEYLIILNTEDIKINIERLYSKAPVLKPLQARA